MTSMQMKDHQGSGASRFPVSILIEKRPATSPWIKHVWNVIGVTVGQRDTADGGAELIHEENGVEHYLLGGLDIKLYPDECESYYHNMMTETPRCYVVAHINDDNREQMPEPFMVTLSFDAAHAYLEGEDEVYGVDIPPELYKWTEGFVLEHYVATKRKKRKLVDWSASSQQGRVS